VTEIKNPKTERSSFPKWMALAGLIVILDQTTKWAIIKWVELHAVGLEITSWFRITHRRNLGAAWSFLADAGGWQRWFLAVLAVAVSGYITYWLWTLRNQRNLVLCIGLALVLGGALGNVIDRIVLGYVIDFVAVDIFGWQFPAFNVADSAISVGAAFLIIDALFFSKLGEIGTDQPGKKEA
jgi:signal peptidase II